MAQYRNPLPQLSSNLFITDGGIETTLNWKGALNMTLEEVMTLLDAILPKPLNDLHSFVFQQAWEGRSYAEMADRSAYDETYLKSVGARIWKSLSKATNQNVTKSNVRSSLESHARQNFPALSILQRQSALALTSPALGTMTGQDGNGTEASSNDDFYKFIQRDRRSLLNSI
jgi:hypothetical protein